MATTSDTRERILHAARNCFVDSGYAATSIRQITTAADVNVAAVNYHFGGKEALFFAILEEPLAWLAIERRQRLEAALTNGDSPSMNAVIAALLEPLIIERPGHETVFSHGPMIARAFHEVPELRERAVNRFFRETGQRFMSAFQQLYPTAPEAEVQSAFSFAVSTMIGGFCYFGLPESSECTPVTNAETTVDRLICFIAAGVDAQLGRFEVAG